MPGAHRVAQRRLRQQASRMVRVLHVGNRDGGIRDAIVDHRVHRHRHAVLGEHLQTHIHTQTICIYVCNIDYDIHELST